MLNKDEILKKWAPIISSTMSRTIVGLFDPSDMTIGSGDIKNSGILLPIAVKMVAKTLAMDLVSVVPLGGGNSYDELKRIEGEVKMENRDSKIESLIDGKDYVEKKIEDHKDYRKSKDPNGSLYYMDYVYGKPNKKKNNKI